MQKKLKTDTVSYKNNLHDTALVFISQTLCRQGVKLNFAQFKVKFCKETEKRG